jgi:hypothetical protein
MMTKKHNQLKNIRKIALIGFSGPNLAMLEYCFSSAVDCELVTASSALILVVNGDQGLKDDDLQAQINDKHSDAFKLVISIRDIAWDGFVLLKKPHTSHELLDAIRRFEIELHEEASQPLAPHEKHSGKEVRPENVDVFRGGDYAKKRQGEALKQKLMRGNLVVSASDRLVKQLEDDIKAQEAELHAQLEAEKLKHTKELLAKKKALKIKELKLIKLQKKRLEKERLEQARLEQALLKREKEEQGRSNSEQVAPKKVAQKEVALEQAEKHTSNKGSADAITVEVKEKAKPKLKAKEILPKTVASDPFAIKALVSDTEKPKEYKLSDQEVLQRCGNASDIDFTKSVERRSVFLNPEDSLLVKITEAVELAQKVEQPVEITGLPGKMFFFPEDHVFYSTFADDFLNQLALTRFGYQEIDIEPQEGFELEDKSKHLSESAESLIWKVAIWTARGRLLNGMDPEKLLQLTTKPDFDRFLTLPNCEAISDVWAGHSVSALDIVKILDVPQRVVFAFMSGAYSLGWFQE